MAVSRISREDMVEQAVTDHLREQLFTIRGYPPGRVELLEAFVESAVAGPLLKNYVCAGFNFDDGGQPLELGSDLVRRTYTIEVWVIGQSAAEGRNLANAVRDALSQERLVALRDVSAAGAPIIDYLIVERVSVHREPVGEPKPWQEFLWIVTVPVVDEYFTGQA